MSWFRLFIINWKFHLNEFIQIEFDSILKAQIKVESKLPCANISQFPSSKLYKIKFISFQYLLDEIINFINIFSSKFKAFSCPHEEDPVRSPWEAFIPERRWNGVTTGPGKIRTAASDASARFTTSKVGTKSLDDLSRALPGQYNIN